ncbi:MAG: glycerol kinase [Planctomycetes bacterium]|nr:glycerol kinase [Planctomycetota bacterium]
MAHYLTLDQGTTSSRALVFDAVGRVVALAAHEFEQHFPAPGLVEHDPGEILATQRRAMLEAWEAAGRPAIEAVGITNQRETVVVFDRRTGEPIHRAIVWQDRRTAGWLRQHAAQAARIRERTGLPLDPYFSASKIAWILDHVSGARAAAERRELGAATIDAWLVHRLTGGRVFATEPSNASRTQLFDLHAFDWSDELCDLFGVPRAMLPEIRASAGDFGVVEGQDWPIRGVLGDQQAALFGHAAIESGDSKCTYGTGAFFLINAGSHVPTPPRGLLGTVAWDCGGSPTFAVEGSVMVAGALVQWLRDGLGIIADAREIEQLARSVPSSDEVVIVPAFAGLGTPHWDADARGLIIGLTRGTTRAHLARASLEAMALQVDEVVRAAAEAAPMPSELRVDGGATENDLLLELQAAISGVPVVRPHHLETTALGACRMAMLGAGVAASASELPELPRPDRRVSPDELEIDRDALLTRWSVAVERCKGWAAVGRS